MKREEINALLQDAPREQLQQLYNTIAEAAEVVAIQKPTPQTLLVPVHDPINKGVFLSGEVLVTSVIVQVNGQNGWAMVMDDNPELASQIATVDGAFAAGVCLSDIEELLNTCTRINQRRDAELNERVNSTRVSFDLL